MSDGLVIVTPPDSEPLTLAEAKLHLRVDGSDEDAHLLSDIQAAREQVEHDTGRALMTQTLKLVADGFPAGRDPIRLPAAPLASVSGVVYTDTDGAQQTFPAASYVVGTDRTPGQVSLASGQDWPGTLDQPGVVEVTFIAGYGTAADVPAGLVNAVKLAVQLLYERGDMGPGQTVANVQDAYRSLVSRFDARRYA